MGLHESLSTLTDCQVIQAVEVCIKKPDHDSNPTDFYMRTYPGLFTLVFELRTRLEKLGLPKERVDDMMTGLSMGTAALMEAAQIKLHEEQLPPAGTGQA